MPYTTMVSQVELMSQVAQGRALYHHGVPGGTKHLLVHYTSIVFQVSSEALIIMKFGIWGHLGWGQAVRT